LTPRIPPAFFFFPPPGILHHVCFPFSWPCLRPRSPPTSPSTQLSVFSHGFLGLFVESFLAWVRVFPPIHGQFFPHLDRTQPFPTELLVNLGTFFKKGSFVLRPPPQVLLISGPPLLRFFSNLLPSQFLCASVEFFSPTRFHSTPPVGTFF